MTTPRKCPECDANLTESQAQAKLCPRCAMRRALEEPETTPTVPSTPPEGGPPIEMPAEMGPYTVIRSIGEGGMGEVFLAEQREPIQRQVALKVIKRGMDTKHVVARFETERQALALMEHASIAKVFDAGITQDGRPYFVMEYVQGEPITEYADRRRLSVRERLDLFGKVCAGVQHAHRKGVIHRDIKPSNVLVTQQDAEAIPKIIDFGVAKAIEKPLTEQTLFTEMGIMIGTPEYMSPEQADVSALDVDTRTDVYSLGVVLYELLSGALPFDSAELRRAGYEEIRRRIREEEPSTPSSKVSTLGDGATDAARARRTDVGSFRRELKGDLDWITLKALEKKPSRRYESPLDLSQDIERHLSNLPVVARPPSLPYLARRFARRHWVAMIVAFALVTALAVTAIQAQRGRVVAERARDESEAVSRFLADVLQLGDPNRSGGELTVTQAIERAAPSIETRFGDRPLVQARLFYVIGEVFTRLGRFDEALDVLERSLAIRLEELGENDALTAETLNMLGVLHNASGDYDSSERAYERALRARRSSLGAHHPLTAETLNNLAVVYQKTGRMDEAKANLELALEIRKRELGPRHEMVGRSLSNIGAFHYRRDEYEEALSYFQQALEVQEAALGKNHPALSHTLSNLGTTYGALGDADGAIGVLEQALKVRETAFGVEHPDVATTLLALGIEFAMVDRSDEAHAAFLRTIAICEEKLGADHARTLEARENLGILLIQMDDPTGAIEQLEIVVAAHEERAGPEDLSLFEPLYHLATSLHGTGETARAREIVERAIAIGEASLDPEDPGLTTCRELRGSIGPVD